MWLKMSDVEVKVEVPLVPRLSDSTVSKTFHSVLGVQSYWVGNEVQDLSSSE